MFQNYYTLVLKLLNAVNSPGGRVQATLWKNGNIGGVIHMTVAEIANHSKCEVIVAKDVLSKNFAGNTIRRVKRGVLILNPSLRYPVKDTDYYTAREVWIECNGDQNAE